MWAFLLSPPPNTEIQTARRDTDVTTEASLDTIRARRVTDVTTEASLGTIRAHRVPVAALDAGGRKKMESKPK